MPISVKEQIIGGLRLYKKNPGCEPVCLWCLRDLHHDATLISIFSEKSIVCHDCQMKLSSREICFHLDDVEVTSFHEYDEHISRLLILYKEHLDEALAPIFFDTYKKQINKKYKGYVCVPLPSSSEKVLQRGFHHLHRMIESLDLKMVDILVKTKNVKQAKLSKEERKHIDMIFEIKENSECSFDKIVLIDDVCTTGASLKAAIALLRPHCNQLRAFTFAYHPLWKTADLE